MALPVVVIIGRPNVGKSSLLNMLARERISIVDPRAGITRDRVTALIERDGRYFELVDTGGIGIIDDDQLESHVEEQIEIAIHRADLILFTLDTSIGIAPLDQVVSERLRPLGKPVIVVANKCDDPARFPDIGAFNRFGFGEPLPISALHSHGREALLARIMELIPESDDAPDEPVMKLAIVGKRNAGKSTLVNALAGEPRMIVSEIPGTTRDAVDVEFVKDGRQFIAIDTAGVRKRKSMGDIDFYSYTRALRSIRRADVVLLLIDATVPIAEVDLKLAAAIQEEFKPVVIGVNKWDLVRGRATSSDYSEYLTGVMHQLRYAPIAFLTARDGKNIDATVDVAMSLHRQARTRLTTSKLNTAVRQITQSRAPTTKHGGKMMKVYYATQISVTPPAIVLFCNEPDLVREEYRRFMENRLREVTPFQEVPIRLMFRSHHRAKPADREGAVELAEDAAAQRAVARDDAPNIAPADELGADEV